MPKPGPLVGVVVAISILAAGAAVVTAMRLTRPASDPVAATYTVDTREHSPSDLRTFEIDDISSAPVELTPGAQGVRAIRLTNPNSVDITVIRLEAVAGQPSDAAREQVAACPSDVVTILPLDTPVVIPPGSSAEVSLVVRVARNVPVACADAVFPVTYSGHTAEIG